MAEAFSQSALAALCQRAQAAGVLHEEMTWDPSEEIMVVRSSQDVDAILDHNKERENYGISGDGYNADRSMRYVAEIPLILVEKWLREEGLNVYRDDHWERLRAKLNDPEYRYLRTSGGRV